MYKRQSQSSTYEEPTSTESHNSLDETQLIASRVYMSELNSDCEKEIKRHEELIRQTSHLIAACKMHEESRMARSTTSNKISSQASVNTNERAVEAHRLLLISNEEIVRLETLQDNLIREDSVHVFNSQEFNSRCGRLSVKNIRLPVQVSMLPEGQDLYNVLGNIVIV